MSFIYLHTDPFATVTLYEEDSMETKRTHTQHKTKNPVFNESFDFDVTTDVSTPLNVLSLVVTMSTTSTLIGREEILGHVIFSLTSPQQEAIDHWKMVQNQPHKRHIVWHKMLDHDELC